MFLRSIAILMTILCCVTGGATQSAHSVTSEPVSFRNGSVALAGTLYLPAGKGPHPAIVVFHAANGGQRDFHAYRHLTTALPAAGMAVLLYDRRGSGASTGDFNTATFEDLARDGIAGVSYLETRSDIDHRRIGAWGMSQGGWLAPLAATLSRDIAFIVSVSGPGVTPAEQMDYSAANALRATGQPREVIRNAMAVRKAVNDYYRGRLSKDDAERAVSKIRGEPWFNDVFLPNSGTLPDEPMRTKWNRTMDYDPLSTLAHVRVPTAFFFAENDSWVPVEESINNIRRATGSNRAVTIARVPGTDHLMETGKPDSGGMTSERYVTNLLGWLRRNTSV